MQGYSNPVFFIETNERADNFLTSDHSYYFTHYFNFPNILNILIIMSTKVPKNVDIANTLIVKRVLSQFLISFLYAKHNRIHQTVKKYIGSIPTFSKVVTNHLAILSFILQELNLLKLLRFDK